MFCACSASFTISLILRDVTSSVYILSHMYVCIYVDVIYAISSSLAVLLVKSVYLFSFVFVYVNSTYVHIHQYMYSYIQAVAELRW